MQNYKGECVYVNSGETNSLDPILLDIAGLGYPAVRAGRDGWRKDRPYLQLPATFYRPFDLDGTGKKSIEWVTGQVGLLVWVGPIGSESALTELKVGEHLAIDGTRVFGGFTWGKPWADGYAALKSLDQNGDGQLTSTELTNLALWIDHDGDAKLCDLPGREPELIPASYYLEAISVDPSRDAQGNAWVEGIGALTKNGKNISSFSWWPRMRYIPYMTRDANGKEYPPVFLHQGSDPQPEMIYRWLPDSQEGAEHGLVGGYLRFCYTGSYLYVLAVSSGTEVTPPPYEGGPEEQFCILVPVRVTYGKTGIILEWYADDIYNKATYSDGALQGATFGPASYTWTATISSDNNRLVSSLALADLSRFAEKEPDFMANFYLDILPRPLVFPQPILLDPASPPHK